MAKNDEELIQDAIRKAKEKASEEAQETEKNEAEETEASESSEADGTGTGETESSGAEEAEENAGEEAKDRADEESTEETDKPAGGETKKKSFFSKKDKKDKRDEQIADLNDKLLRNLAEFENFRKRTEREKSQMFEVGAKSIIEKMLPALDSFERGIATIPEDQKDSPLAQGMEAIYRQLLSSLEEAGVKQIECVGQEFNPDFHNAVMHEDNDELGENIVSEEFQKGYMYRDSVVRHSMVKVAN